MAQAALAERGSQYDHWERLLAGEQGLKAHLSTPESGFWKKSQLVEKGRKVYAPVAIWRENGALICVVNGKERDAAHAVEIWPWCEPITEDLYHHVVAGGDWPGTDPVVAAQMAPGAGHNNPPEDPAEILKEQIDAAKAGADAYAKIADDETLARAQSLRSRLLELKLDAEKRHKKEKEPHLEAGRVTDRKWFPLRDAAQAAADAIRRAMSAFETEKLQRRRELEEKQRREAEAEAQRIRDRDITLAESGVRVPELAPAPPITPAPAPIKGAYGKAASVKPVTALKDVTDYDAVYAHFKNYPEVQALLLKLAQKAVKDGFTVPGVTTEEKADIR